MAWSPFRVSNAAKRSKRRRIHAMRPVQQNRTGQPWHKPGRDVTVNGNALDASRRGSPRPSPAARVGGIARGDSLEISDRLALLRSLQREDPALRVLAPDHATAARHLDRSLDDAAASSLHALRRRVNVAGVEIE